MCFRLSKKKTLFPSHRTRFRRDELFHKKSKASWRKKKRNLKKHSKSNTALFFHPSRKGGSSDETKKFGGSNQRLVFFFYPLLSIYGLMYYEVGPNAYKVNNCRHVGVAVFLIIGNFSFPFTLFFFVLLL